MGDVERCHKITARTRTKVSNRKVESTTEVYCNIAVSESNKRGKVQVQNVMQASRLRLNRFKKLCEERVLTAQAITEARRVADGDAELDDDDEHVELDSLVDEVLDELGYEFEDSEDEL